MISALIDWIQRLLKLRTPNEIIASLLVGHERVIMIDGPAEIAFLTEKWKQILLMMLFIGLAFGVGVGWWVWILATLGAIMGLVVLFGAIQDHYTRYVITTTRILRVNGVISRSHEWIPWAKITDLSFVQSPVDRLLGIARVRIESANEASAFKEMTDLSHPREFMKLLVFVVARRQGQVELPDNLHEILGIPRHETDPDSWDGPAPSWADESWAAADDTNLIPVPNPPADRGDPRPDVAPGDVGDAALFD